MPEPSEDGGRIFVAAHEIEKHLYDMDETEVATTIGYVLSSYGEEKLDKLLRQVNGVARAAAWSRQWRTK